MRKKIAVLISALLLLMVAILAMAEAGGASESDTTPPVPDFQIRNQDGLTLIEVIENISYQFDASLTTDNSDELANLTFEWIFAVGDMKHNYTGVVVNFTFSGVGMYNVTLKATDKANNTANKTRLVFVNLGRRPNIVMKLGSMRFSSDTGTAGKKMTIYVNITNDGQENATNVQTTFYIRSHDGTDTKIGAATTDFLEVGGTATPSVTWTPENEGKYSIWANVFCEQEHASQWWDNKIQDFSETSTQRVTVNPETIDNETAETSSKTDWTKIIIYLGIPLIVCITVIAVVYLITRKPKP